MAKKVINETKAVSTINVDELSTKLEGFSNVEEMKKWAETIIESGLLPTSITEPEQVITLVQTGKELGLTPLTALNNLHVIAGRPVISSSMLGALLKRRNIEWIIEEDFARVTHGEGDEASVDRRTTYKFFWKSKVTEKVMEATHSVSWRQLEIAGYTEKQNYSKYPKEMMRARCLSSAVRALFPEVLMGLYSDIELNDIPGAENYDVAITEEGDATLIINPEIKQD